MLQFLSDHKIVELPYNVTNKKNDTLTVQCMILRTCGLRVNEVLSHVNNRLLWVSLPNKSKCGYEACNSEILMHDLDRLTRKERY